MSTPNDQNQKEAKKVQKVKKISPNLYEIHFDRKPKLEKPARSSSRVLKAEDLNTGLNTSTLGVYQSATLPSSVAQAYGSSFQPGARLGAQPLGNSSNSGSEKTAPSITVHGLKQNLKSLNDLHSKLRMMLTELEEFVRI